MSNRAGTAPFDARARDEGLCQFLFESIREYAIIALDPKGRIAGWNPGAERLFGYAEPEIGSEHFSRLFTREALERGEPDRQLRAATEQERAEDERWRVRKDGTRFWGSGAITALRNHTGELTGFAEVVHDLTERHEAEMRLRLLGSVVLNASDAVMITDPEPLEEPGPRIQYVNPAFTHQTGYGAEEAIGQSPRFLQGPGTDPEATARIRAALQRREAVCEELLNYRKDGSPFWVEVSIVPIVDDAGRLTHWASVQRDVTPRKEAQEAALHLAREEAERAEAERSRAVLSAIIGIAADAIVSVDEEQRIILFNRGAEEIFGYTEEDALGERLDLLVPEGFRGAHGAQLREFGESGVRARRMGTQGRITGRRKDGEIFPMEASISKVELEGRKIYTTVARDISASVEAAQALRESNEALGAVIRATPLALTVIDPEGKVEMWNPAAERIFGWTEEEALGRPMPIVPPEMEEEHRRIRETAMRGETITALETHRQRKDGSQVLVQLSTAPLRDEEGRVRGTMVLHEDSTDRRRAEESLRQTSEILQAIVRAAPVAITALDLRGRVEIWNPAAERIFGWTEAEARGEVTPIVPEEKQGELRDELAAASRGGAVVGLETERLRKDGSRLAVNLATAPIRDGSGEIRGMMSLIQDITERKRAEEEERRLAAILEATPDFVTTADPEGRTLYLNRAGRRMLGIGADEALPGLDPLIIHPEHALGRILREAIPTAIREGSWSGETVLRHRNGSEIPVSQVILAHHGADGEVEFLSSIARDVSDRIRREEELRFLAGASQAFVSTLEYGATLEGLAQLGVSRLADLCIVDIVEEAGTRRVALAHRDPEREEALQHLRRYAPQARRPVGVEAAIRTGKPELVPHVSAAWLRGAATDAEHLEALRELAPRSAMIVPLVARGRTFGAVSLFVLEGDRPFGPDDLALAEELARRAALAVDNARLYEESQQATRARDEVLRIVAHDLRNPLNTISLSAGYLQEIIPEEREGERRQAAIIRRSVERANRLIQDLLDVARVEARQLTVERRRGEVAPLLQEAVELHRALAREKGLRLETQIPEGLPAVEADRDRLLQVLSNLLGNAIKFTPPGGSIVVGATVVEGEVRISVSDTGPGIPREQLSHLFDPFWQARRGARDGAGLGLAIARGITEAHGGRMWVDSEPGTGTTFYVAIPAADDDPEGGGEGSPGTL